MIRLFTLILVDVVVFVGLRVFSVLVLFLFGIGASGSSEEQTDYILIPALVVQLFIIWLLYSKKKFVRSLSEFWILALIVIVLFALGQFNLIAF
jgi:hypothetical protein